MSSGFPQTQSPKKGGGMFFILLFVGIAMFMFSQNAGNQGNQRQAPQGEGKGLDINTDVDLDLDKGRQAGSPKIDKSRQGDWGMEDVATSKNKGEAEGSKKSSSVRNGDWGMEDVETKPTSKDPKERRFQFSNDRSENKSENPAAEDPKNKAGKKTKNGDWGMEDVEPKPANKKTQKGDWGLEEVGSGKGN